MTVFSFILAVGAAEIWARGQIPVRIQKFYTAELHQMEEVDGTPVWTSNPTESIERWNLDCIDSRPEAPRVVLLGSSILYGVRLDQADTLGPQLAQRLDASPCVLNLSEAGSTLQVQRARLAAEFPTIQPDVLVLEIWSNSPKQFHVLGDAAYNFGRLETDSMGFPNPYELDPEHNFRLLDAFGLYRFLVFGSTPEDSTVGDDWGAFATEEIADLIDWTEERGIELVLVFCPSLGTDFQTTLERSERSYGHVERFAASQGIPSVYLAREFIDLDPEELALDSCCHFNPRGTMEVADRLAPVIDAVLDGAGDSQYE